jgi:Bacterial alpha-L-rhamnosidase 6 hairpin glycosidase domain/Bacterial alpha-L-rhamnosidase C-terminal domain
VRGAIAAVAAALMLAAASSAPAAPHILGSFSTSDPLLRTIWARSVRTATDMVARGPITTDAEGRPCAIALKTVLLDGAKRDRCPYVGDQAVTGMTLLVSHPEDAPVLRGMIEWYAEHQHHDGSIPASPYARGVVTDFDYNAYWVEDVYDYVLYTGDLTLAKKVWRHLIELMNDWYPAQTGPDGLLVNKLGPLDYANIPRAGTTVAYYNAGYVLALREASAIAAWIGHRLQAAAWDARVGPVAAAFGPAFWDPIAGAYVDTPTGPIVHPQDGNVFAVLAGLTTLARARTALDYLSAHEWQPYGATLADNDTWHGYPWGDQASQRVYPFIGYFDVVARYQSGLDSSAVALIRREWGYMVKNGPRTTMWETIGPGGGPPVDQTPSYDHGWSSGAAPALTSYALGVTPASPGFGTYVAQPHPADLQWARGVVPTPHGPIRFTWAYGPGVLSATVVAPMPGRITLPADGSARLDGKSIARQRLQTSVTVPAGRHTLVVATS